MLPTTFCLARSQTQTEQIVERLRAAGVPLSTVSVLSLPSDSKQSPLPIKGLSYPDAVGAETAAGAATGGLTGMFAAIGTMFIVGLTPLLMIAPLVVAGGAALGVVAGTLVTGLSGYGVSAARLDHYQRQLLAGGFLVSVQTEDEAQLDTAQKIFVESDAQDINSFRYTRKLTRRMARIALTSGVSRHRNEVANTPGEHEAVPI